MRRARILGVWVLAVLLALGCGGPTFYKTKGRILRGGAPYKTNPGEGLRIFFVPLERNGSTYDSYPAQFSNDGGVFQVMGKDGRGLPPGKYRVDLQLMKNKEDLFNNRLLGPKSPFQCEVTSGFTEVVLDLDQAKDLLPPPG